MLLDNVETVFESLDHYQVRIIIIVLLRKFVMLSLVPQQTFP